jgi:hypothetical protein
VTRFGLEDDMLAESEVLLEGILEKLGRDPAGMLTDFDLYATRSYSNSRAGQGQSGVGAAILSETARVQLGDRECYK